MRTELGLAPARSPILASAPPARSDGTFRLPALMVASHDAVARPAPAIA